MKTLEEIKGFLNSSSFADKIDYIDARTIGRCLRIQTWFCYRDGDVIDLYLYIKDSLDGPVLMLSDLGMSEMNFSSQMIDSPDEVPDFTMVTNFSSLRYDMAHVISKIYHYEARFIKC